jgi:hypothetical protein
MGITLAVAGCGSSDTGSSAGGKSSCGIETRAMRASLSVQARGERTRIFAALLSDGNVTLGCGDTLSATVSGHRMVLAREADSGSGPIHYTAALASPATESTVVVALERSAKAGAPASTVYLPRPFAVRDVSPTVKIANDDLQFRLDPPIDADVVETRPDSTQLRIELEGPCLEPIVFTWSKSGVLFPPLVKADGTVVLVNGRQFMRRKGDQSACDVALHVTTFTAGALDPAFAGAVQASSPAEGSRHEEAQFHLEW